MKGLSTLAPAAIIACFVLANAGCGDTVSPDDPGNPEDVIRDVIDRDASFFDAALDGGSDHGPQTDDGNETGADIADDTPDAQTTDEGPRGLPDVLPITFTRDDDGDPLTQAEIDAFTRRMMRFLQDTSHFDYVLYTIHGVDASTGLRDFAFWYNEHMRREGELVTFYHPQNLNDGGHNLHIRMGKIMANLAGAWMAAGDEKAGLALGQLCKGMTASMLGMVHDENDDVPHLMSRNVVMMQQEFDTHDGRRKAVDPSGWYSSYERWNCDRYQITENPYWGDVWVTNLRSKDDVPFIYRMIPTLNYVVKRSPPGDTLDACTEALGLLEAFARDIVDHDYRIRTKDFDGTIYEPGYTGDPESDGDQGDISSFTYWRDFIPKAECSARGASHLIGYGQAGVESCGRGEPNDYDDISFVSNGYNKEICQFFHLSHLAMALILRHDEDAVLLMDGLVERLEEDLSMASTQQEYPVSQYERDQALILEQSSVYGFPLTSSEVRLIHQYYGRAIDRTLDWPYWDPWDESVPDGDLGSYRPPNCEGSGDERICWTRVEDMSGVWEYCWSPLKNPAGRPWINCDIVLDPDSWDDDLDRARQVQQP